MTMQAKSRAACTQKDALPMGGEGAAARAEAHSQSHQQSGPMASEAPAVCITPLRDGTAAGAGEEKDSSDGQQDSEVQDSGLPVQQHAVPERLVPGSRDGAMYSGAFGRDRDLRLRMLQEQRALIRCNPIAFQEDMASQADAKYRCLIACMSGGNVGFTYRMVTGHRDICRGKSREVIISLANSY